ncbi:MAG TPA: TonB-dependent receptor [Bacteroidales bacterium]|nr:TonB-dependent receptor [Bacteroidales bacterium]
MKKTVFIAMILFLANAAFAQENYSIGGKVRDINGEPLAGASVTIENTFLGVSTAADGTYSFRGLHEGTYTLRFSYIGFEVQEKEIKVPGDPGPDITLTPLSYLTGEVLVNATRASNHAPLAYSSIERDILKKTNVASDMPYLLSLTPSLVETSEAGNGVGYTGMRIRGTDANRINVTIDGIPLNDPESHTVFWVDLPDLASSIDNIQIQRGVGTSSNGAGAFGATVSLQTLNPEPEPYAELNSAYGSFNTYRNMVSASTGMISDRFAVQMRYSDLHSDGYIDRTWSNHRSAYLSGLYRTGRSLLKTNIILGEEHTGLGWWGVPVDSINTNRKYNPAGEYTDENGNTRYYGNESDNYNQDHYQLIYSLKATESLNINAALHYTKGKGYYEEYKEDQPFSEYNLAPVIAGGETVSSTDLIRRKWLDNDFLGLVYSASLRKNRADFTLGGGLNTYLGDHYGTIIWMGNTGGTEKDYRWYFNKSTKSEFNIFGKLNYGLSDRTRIFGDLQYRFISYDMNGQDDDLKDLTQQHRFGFFNPKAGLFHNINPNQDAWLSFAVANREPTRADYKEASGDEAAEPLPETLYDVEAGYKLRSGKSSLAVNLYGMFYNNQLVPTGELSNVGYPIMSNVPKSYRLGVELSSAVKLMEYMTWNANLTISRNKILDFTEYYTDYNTADWSSQYLSKNLGLVDIAYSPSTVFTNDISFAKGWVGLHFITKYVARQYFDNTMNEGRSIDPYLVNNLRLDFSPVIHNVEGIDLQFIINNILNEEYENNAYGGNWYEDGAEKTWAYYFPQAGINYMLRLGIRF